MTQARDSARGFQSESLIKIYRDCKHLPWLHSNFRVAILKSKKYLQKPLTKHKYLVIMNTCKVQTLYRYLLVGVIIVEKNVQVSLLFAFYKNMLTERQIECVDLYYNEDLSLSEISEHLDITRQGVRDNIMRAEKSMRDMESRLGLVKKFLGIKQRLERIDDIIREIEKSPNVRFLSDDIKHKINEILITIGEINEE